MARRTGGHRLVRLIAAIAVIACQPTGEGSGSPAAPTATELVAPTDTATPLEMEAMRLREIWGFPATLADVRAIAADPTAITEPFGVPFLPAELREMRTRAVGRDAVLEAVIQESERGHADFCGVYSEGNTVVSMWRANLHTHAINIALDTNSFEYLAFVDTCSYSWNELLALKERIGQDDALEAWLGTIPARWTSVGPDTLGNHVSLDISSAVPDAAERVHQHIVDELDVPPGMLVVRSDGTGQVLRPWGTVRIVVVRPNGKPVGPNDLGFFWEPLDPPNGACGVGDMGFGPSWDERPAELPCQEGTWRIRVMYAGTELGSGTVAVEDDGTVDLTIRLTADPPSSP